MNVLFNNNNNKSILVSTKPWWAWEIFYKQHKKIFHDPKMLNCSVKNNYSPDLYTAFRYHETHKIPQYTELINMWLLSRSSVTNHHKMLRKCIFVWEGSCMLCLFIFMFVTNSWRSNAYLCSWHNEAHWFYKCITRTWTHTLTGGEARCEVDELLHELAEAELGKQVTVTGAAVKNTDTHT